MISIDLTDAIPPGLLAYPGLVRNAIPDIVEAIRTEIVAAAQADLLTSGADYVQGVQPAKYFLTNGQLPDNQVVATIVLTGWLPNAIEHGWPGGDMKAWLLMGRNARQLPDGTRVNVVPFRHGTPGTTGRHAPPMGSGLAFGVRMGPYGPIATGVMGRSQSEKVGKQIHKLARALTPTTSHPGQQTAWGGRLPAGLVPKLEPHHKTDIYAGMVRQEKAYRKATQSQYTTFRAVSDRSDPRAWFHPGIEPRDFFGRAGERAGSIAARLLQSALDGAIKGGRA